MSNSQGQSDASGNKVMQQEQSSIHRRILYSIGHCTKVYRDRLCKADFSQQTLTAYISIGYVRSLPFDYPHLQYEHTEPTRIMSYRAKFCQMLVHVTVPDRQLKVILCKTSAMEHLVCILKVL